MRLFIKVTSGLVANDYAAGAKLAGLIVRITSRKDGLFYVWVK